MFLQWLLDYTANKFLTQVGVTMGKMKNDIHDAVCH